jgi:hypothetical protein
MPLVVGGFLIAAAAIAAAHIPARYVGPFPDFGRLKNITGVFAGTSLTLKGTTVLGTRFVPTTGNFACTRASDTQIRCRGKFESDTGQFAKRTTLAVTWANGVPVKMSH